MCYNYYYYEYFFNIKNMIQKKGFSIEFQTRNKYWSFFLFLTNDGSDGNWKRGIGLCGSINLEFVDLDSREFDYFGLSLPACYWWMLTCCGFIILVFCFQVERKLLMVWLKLSEVDYWLRECVDLLLLVVVVVELLITIIYFKDLGVWITRFYFYLPLVFCRNWMIEIRFYWSNVRRSDRCAYLGHRKAKLKCAVDFHVCKKNLKEMKIRFFFWFCSKKAGDNFNSIQSQDQSRLFRCWRGVNTSNWIPVA